MSDKNNILYLFDRPTEPIFIGKGDENVSFDIPPEYWVSRFIKSARADFNIRFEIVPQTLLIAANKTVYIFLIFTARLD